WRQLLNAYLTAFIIHSVLIIGMVLLSRRFVYPFIQDLIVDDLTARIITILITLILMAPFIWALAIRRIKKEAYSNLWLNRKLNRRSLLAIGGTRIGVAVLYVGFLVNLFFSPPVTFVI